jgi:ABC-type antimicrobial peptide transport system permease subunit
MIILENIQMALQSLKTNPLRSALTLTGIAVGIGAVLYVVILGDITQQRINERLESLGSNVLLIRPGYSHMRGVRTAENVVNLKWDEANDIETTSNVIIAAVPIFRSGGC